MTIPSRLQIFPEPVVLSDKDAERLQPHLAGWHTLKDVIWEGMNEADLKRLLVLEMMSERRTVIADRLIARICKLQRQALTAKVLKLIK